MKKIKESRWNNYLCMNDFTFQDTSKSKTLNKTSSYFSVVRRLRTIHAWKLVLGAQVKVMCQSQ